jgi:hypothetical protein
MEAVMAVSGQRNASRTQRKPAKSPKVAEKIQKDDLSDEELKKVTGGTASHGSGSGAGKVIF